MAATPLPPDEPARPRAQPAPNAIGLDRLAPGERAVVRGMSSEGPIERRLLDLGLLPGTVVRALRRAPLGDPVEYELRGYRLCLRQSEARRVRIERLASAAHRNAHR